MSRPSSKESFRDFKIRVIDPISDTYCGAKWYNATIWLGHGQTTSCHHPPAHYIDVNEIATNPSAIHNTQHKKQMRKLMLEGKRPAECEYCWKVEDIGRDNISDRVFKTHINSDEDIAASAKMPWDADVELKTLEISFERTCNFACSYCNPAFSTTWVKDIKKNGPYLDIVSDGRGHFNDTAPWAENAADDEKDNPYIQAFWKWWDSSLSDNLEEIRITGGEPLMAASVWKLFDWFKNNPEKAKKMRFAINSNLVPKDALIDKLIEASKHVPHLEIYTSNEAKGQQADYIRDGMDYDKWWYNIQRLQTEGNVKSIHCMMTINSLCLPSITEFMDDVMDFKRRNNTSSPTLSLNILRFPSFQSAAMLPRVLKDIYRGKLQAWLDKIDKSNEKVIANGQHGKYRSPILAPWEREQVVRLIDYLDVVKTPHKDAANIPELHHDFKRFFEQYDERRGKSFKDTFPIEMVSFFTGIQLVNSEPITVSDPSTTAEGYVSDK